MNVDKLIKTRRSIKKFKNKKPDWRVIIECIDAMRFAPTAGKNFINKIILVDEPEKIQKLASAAQQPFVANASYVVVVCANASRPTNAYGKRGARYTEQQSGAAIQNFLLKLHEKGLATCWVGHFVDNLVKTALKIPDETDVVAIFPIGYANEKPREYQKTDLDACLYFNEYKKKQMRNIKKTEN